MQATVFMLRSLWLILLILRKVNAALLTAQEKNRIDAFMLKVDSYTKSLKEGPRADLEPEDG